MYAHAYKNTTKLTCATFTPSKVFQFHKVYFQYSFIALHAKLLAKFSVL